MAEKIQVNAVIEMLGGPKEYIEQVLKDYIETRKKEGLDVKSEVYHEGVPRDTLFTTFTELELHFNDMDELLDFCFESMPSSLEITHPENLKFTNIELTDFLNDLQAKIHQNDLLVKNYRAQNHVLDKNATNVFKNFLTFLVKKEVTDVEEMSKHVGVKPEELKPFLDKLVEDNKIKKEGEKYVHSERAEERA